MNEADPTPTPKRFRYRWSLSALFVVVTISAICIGGWLRYSAAMEWVDIAAVGDPGTAKAMRELLEAHGIECGYEGSVVYYVAVHRHDAPRSCKLIRSAGTGLGTYQNWVADY